RNAEANRRARGRARPARLRCLPGVLAVGRLLPPGRRQLAFSPPFIVEEGEIGQIFEIVADAIRRTD
ncbi:MAG: hypothetical protein OXF51_09560, partial [Alphaproteobacteria bacterium]|nr:hypothetical protein [Alphaproteobacteria bacterium]